MDSAEIKQLKLVLRKVVDGIGEDGSVGYLETLRQIDRMMEKETFPKKLAHYLSRRSYLKALEYLESGGEA